MLPPNSEDLQSASATDSLTKWMTSELACIAGRRELARGRYLIADLAEQDMAQVLVQFQQEVRELRKVALLCLIPRTAANMDPHTPSIEVLRELSCFGAAVSDRRPEELLNSAVLEFPLLLDCPVTGLPTTYSFFGVAFCPQAANADDALYDLPLSAPFPCINITSDGFAFAMFVRDTALERHGVPPHQLAPAELREALFADCVARWQRFSLHTLSVLAERTQGTRCPVRVSDDGRYWQAAHNDPVFAETVKAPHTHDMPKLYAAELVQRWTLVLAAKGQTFHARSGQSGGRPTGQPPEEGGCPFADMAGGGHKVAAAH